ncbi:glycosyltransferase family 1 protein [Roseburia sp. BX0805]|uniref:Glycosyltransferase family 1 protein n=1 Tax=Roseburia yibonii TaxID=2763063 RepID=A0ABR7IBW1_9FIRM|nr:glycosyltransferase [Roseburia yibonii]MBC5754428.1 glycosyltransferase family 1 protein [Roseburia yibonii]
MDQEKKKPVLLFTSREICYYSADFFMNQMAEAFETLGYPARLCVLDLEKDVDAQLAPYVGNSYMAVLDINSLLPRAVMDNGTPYLEQLDAPFYNYLVDHPFYHHPGLSVPLKNYHVLCLDENHVAYAKKYYPHLESVSLLPLGATKALVPVPVEQKKESVLFIGTYNCAADVYREMEELPQGLKADDKALIDIMLADPAISQEEAFRSLLAGRGEELTDAEFAFRMNRMYHVDRYLRNYYREEAIRTLVRHHIPVTVLGNNWEQLKEQESRYFTIQPPVDFSMTFQKIAEYEVLLNVSPLFKAGVHDRVFAAMANQTVCLTDRNGYMERNFKDGGNISLFSLKHMEELPDMAEEFLSNPTRRQEVTAAAQMEFDRKHSWLKRTEQFINLMEKEQK